MGETEKFLYELKPSLVTNMEMKYLNCIKAILPENCLIQAQANFASFIVRTDAAKFQNELYRSVDFIITDLLYKPLLIIEINDQTHLTEDSRERDKKVANICEEAGEVWKQKDIQSVMEKMLGFFGFAASMRENKRYSLYGFRRGLYLALVHADKTDKRDSIIKGIMNYQNQMLLFLEILSLLCYTETQERHGGAVMYKNILDTITNSAKMNFDVASAVLEDCVNADEQFLETLKQIGTIPESIAHDSTEEKLFSKASDAVLTRAFREIGLKAKVLKGRGDSADVFAESSIFGYTLVADAKAFRMSRTAKNQKDFKVVALSGWRKDSEYAVLCAPYFQYPSSSSQIYAQAIEHNVCLLSWEHLIFLIEHGVKENKELNLSELWGFCDAYSHKVLYSEAKKCFSTQFDDTVLRLSGWSKQEFISSLEAQTAAIAERGKEETAFLYKEKEKIEQYSREQAISQLIKAKKIHEKIDQINTYVRGLQA